MSTAGGHHQGINFYILFFNVAINLKSQPWFDRKCKMMTSYLDILDLVAYLDMLPSLGRCISSSDEKVSLVSSQSCPGNLYLFFGSQPGRKKADISGVLFAAKSTLEQMNALPTVPQCHSSMTEVRSL